MKNNYACLNRNGYYILSSTADLFNNIAEHNVLSGFNMATGTSATLRDNTSNNNNTGSGFSDVAGNTNQYYNNTACNNSANMNYVNVNSAPVTSPANARGFDNVDCSKTDADQIDIIESKLDDCCFSLESKLDNLSVFATCDLSGTFTVLNIIESSIDACCFSLESKLDNLSVCASCDLSGTFTVLNAIESSVDACCFSLESKLDVLLSRVPAI